MFEAKLLLDTCALVWLVSDRARLSKNTLDSIQNASIVLISAISAWEIGLKSARDALILPTTPEKWFNEAVRFHNLTVAPLDIPILFQANALPWHHKDPVDRFIIATAIREQATIVTSDEKFLKYGVKIIS